MPNGLKVFFLFVVLLAPVLAIVLFLNPYMGNWIYFVSIPGGIAAGHFSARISMDRGWM